jgi:hypothetical protein
MERSTINVIVYKLDTPLIFNEGTEYEIKKDTFLEYVTYMSDEDAQAEADKLNKTATDRHYFVKKQPDFY